jgi:hypothetical protein
MAHIAHQPGPVCLESGVSRWLVGVVGLGVELGQTVNNIRSANYFVDGNPERRQWLDDEGFAWILKAGITERAREAAVRFGRRRAGLALTLHQLRRNERAQHVVSYTSSGLCLRLGMKLGNTVADIRTPEYFVRDSQERRQWLEEAGFRFETADYDQAASD